MSQGLKIHNLPLKSLIPRNVKFSNMLTVIVAFWSCLFSGGKTKSVGQIWSHLWGVAQGWGEVLTEVRATQFQVVHSPRCVGHIVCASKFYWIQFLQNMHSMYTCYYTDWGGWRLVFNIFWGMCLFVVTCWFVKIAHRDKYTGWESEVCCKWKDATLFSR